MKVVVNNNKDVVVSYHTNKQGKESSQAHKQHIPTRAYDDKIRRIRSLALRKYGKMKGAFFDITDEALEIGLTEIENKLQHTTSFATSGIGEYKADKVDRLMSMQRSFKVWNTESSSSNYPVFHMETIKIVIKDVCKKRKIKGKRTLFTNSDSYLNIIIDLSKEVRTHMYDLSGFMTHEFRG